MLQVLIAASVLETREASLALPDLQQVLVSALALPQASLKAREATIDILSLCPLPATLTDALGDAAIGVACLAVLVQLERSSCEWHTQRVLTTLTQLAKHSHHSNTFCSTDWLLASLPLLSCSSVTTRMLSLIHI